MKQQKITFNEIKDRHPSLDIKKLGKGYQVNGHKCANLDELQKAVKDIDKKLGVPTVRVPQTEGVRIDPEKVVLIKTHLAAPIPSKRVDKERTKTLNESLGSDDWSAVCEMLRDPKTDKKKLHPELQEVKSIRNEWRAFLEKLCIPVSDSGCRVVSNSLIQPIREKAAEVNDRLQAQAKVIIGKLPEWKEIARKRHSLIEEKWPDAAYFSAYSLTVRTLFYGDGNEDLYEEISDNTIEKVREPLNHLVSALSGYISGDSKKFRVNSVENIIAHAKAVSDSGLVSDKGLQKLIDAVIEKAEGFNAEAVREAKNKLDKGVVDPKLFKGRGRKPNGVGQSELDDCKKFLDNQVKTFDELANVFNEF